MSKHLIQLGWNSSFQTQIQNLSNSLKVNTNSNTNINITPARIIREDREQYQIHDGHGIKTAKLTGNFRNNANAQSQPSRAFPTVGDWVVVETKANSGCNDHCVIHSLLNRTSLFYRQSAGNTTEHQLLAANSDYLFIVAGLDQEYNPKRIQRYLTQAWNSGAEPVIILNKSDLIQNTQKLEEIVSELQKLIPDTPIHALSANSGEGLDSMDPYMQQGTTIALSGSSGVGKSTLINVLLGEEKLKTQANRSDDNRGRHTTTWRELLIVDQGPCIIDLPGMREIGLTSDPDEIKDSFSDIRELAKQCKYRNCTHQGEPGCAVEPAWIEGAIAFERYAQFMKLTIESVSNKSRSTQKRASGKPKSGGSKSSVKANPKPNKWAEKEAFFKDVASQHKKNKKAKRKFNQMDGF